MRKGKKNPFQSVMDGSKITVQVPRVEKKSPHLPAKEAVLLASDTSLGRSTVHPCSSSNVNTILMMTSDTSVKMCGYRERFVIKCCMTGKQEITSQSTPSFKKRWDFCMESTAEHFKC